MARVSAQYDLSASIITEDLVRVIGLFTAESIERGGQYMQAIVEKYKSFAESKGNIANINRSLAEGMREAVVEAYDEKVLAVRASPSYAQQGRFGGSNSLGRALKSQSMVVGDAEGISFINTGLLDSAAAQWARLNFGASPNIGNTVGASSPITGRIRFGNGQGRSIRLIEGPGAGFTVPEPSGSRGFFNSKNQLIIGKSAGEAEKVTWVKGLPSEKGIGARHFLDAGLVSLGANFGPAWKEHFNNAKREAIQAGRDARVAAGGRDYQKEYRARLVRGDLKAGH